MALDQNAEFDTEGLESAYERDGFVFPLDILSAEEAKSLREDLEAAERELADDPERLNLLMKYPDRLLPSFDVLIRHPKIIAAVSTVLGPDLLVWGSPLFIKQAKSQKIVSWHQDLTYWQLDDAEEVTIWVALSPATLESGCMKFVAGSHKQRIVPHVDTFDDDNLLSRGQEIAVEVDPEDEVPVILQPGQVSMHHGHLFHASGPNDADFRRIGFPIRYIKPSMKQETGDRPTAVLAAGKDQFGHFALAGPLHGRLHDADFEMCRRDAELKKKILL